MYVCLYVCMYVWMYVRRYVCMYACMHVCMYVCMYVYIYICIYVCMFVCMYVCIYECMYRNGRVMYQIQTLSVVVRTRLKFCENFLRFEFFDFLNAKQISGSRLIFVSCKILKLTFTQFYSREISYQKFFLAYSCEKLFKNKLTKNSAKSGKNAKSCFLFYNLTILYLQIRFFL